MTNFGKQELHGNIQNNKIMLETSDIQNCPFCKKDIKEIAFAESSHFLTIYNIAPILPGHSLVISKKHIISLFELSPKEVQEFMVLAQKSAKILSKAFSVDSFNWSIQERPPAGQTVPHLHMHIIPRKEGDLSSPGDWYPELEKKFYSEHIDSAERSKFTRDQLIGIVKRLKQI